MMKKILVYLLCLLILITPLSPLVSHASPMIGFEHVASIWGSEDQPREVYPGSSNVRLIILVQYTGNITLVNTIGILSLPGGFTSSDGSVQPVSRGTVEKNNTATYSVSPGDIIRYEYLVDVSSNLTEGVYTGILTINYTYLDAGVLMRGSYNVSVPLRVSSLPSCVIEVVDSYWSAPDGTLVNATPGADNAVLNIVIRNKGQDSIDELRATLEKKPPLLQGGGESIITNLAVNEEAVLTYSGITIDYSANPGQYTATLDVKCRVSGYGGAVSYYNFTVDFPLTIASPQDAGVEIVKTSWRSWDERGYPGAQKAYLDIVIQNMGAYTLSNLVIHLYLPEGFIAPTGSSVLTTVFTGNLGHGDTASLSIGPIQIDEDVSPGVYVANLTIEGMGSIGGMTILVNKTLEIPLYVQEYNAMIDIISVEWSYNGEPAICLPNAKNLHLIVTLVNRAGSTLAAIKPEIELPEGFILRSVSGDLERVQPASIFRIILTLDTTSDLDAGIHNAQLTLKFSVEPEGQLSTASYTIPIALRSSSPTGIDTSLSIIGAYWGTTSPQEVYPGAKLVPLTIYVVNKGHYDARSIYSRFVEGYGFSAVSNGVAEAPVLTSGSRTTITMYFNIDKNLTGGRYTLRLRLGYIISVYGAILSKSRDYLIGINVSNPPASSGYLEIIGARWANNYPVYPGTSDATLRLTIANNAPYPVSGINISIIAPPGIALANQGSNYTYISGPVPKWQTFTTDLHLEVSDTVTPGSYNVLVVLEYTLESGGGGIRLIEEKPIEIKIEPVPEPAFIGSYWYKYSPGPGSAGAVLLAVYRNLEIPVMRSLVAQVYLPGGFVLTTTGCTEGNVTPIVSSSLQQLGEFLASQHIPIQGGVQAQAGEGDFIIIPVSLIIGSNVSTGEYDFHVKLYFIDQWGDDRSIMLHGRFVLQGVPRLEIVEEKSRVILGARTTEVSLIIKNTGSGPAYDVYVGIASLSGLIAFSSSLKHVDTIPPGREVIVKWLASASPSLSSSMSVPAMVYLSYSGPAGHRYSINQTAIIYAEGVIELKLSEIEVSPEKVPLNEYFDVSATLINTGTETARNVEIYIRENPYIKTISESYSFIGDIDPGTMIPVTLRGVASNQSGVVGLDIVVVYHNAFNEEFNITTRINITITTSTGEESSSESHGIESYKLLTAGIITVFLAISLFVIYKLYQKSKRVIP